MLIVIVIIGILAAALIPRLSSARGRANDVARKADLAQVATALVAYQIDHGYFPTCPTSSEWCTLNEISEELISAGMASIPTDPDQKRIIKPGVDGVGESSEAGQYAYITITKNIKGNSFVLMAATETEWGSNRVTKDKEDISQSDTYAEISAAMCKEFGENDCSYEKDGDQLRYIYLY